jgi:hypothetical protein
MRFSYRRTKYIVLDKATASMKHLQKVYGFLPIYAVQFDKRCHPGIELASDDFQNAVSRKILGMNDRGQRSTNRKPTAGY